jgi:uncharacterized membrane protein
MSNWSKIWFIVGFICAFLAYTVHPCLWHGAFYHLISFAFVGYTRALYLQTKGDWSLAVFVVWLTCINSFLDEMFFDPKEMQLNEYLGFLVIILITTVQRKRWRR